MRDKTTAGNVKTALRVVEIIETFAAERRPLSLSELAHLLAVPMSSCHGLINTLERLGYLYETARRQGYYPTGRLLAKAQLIARSDPVLDRVHATLSELRDATDETVVFGKLIEDNRVIYLDVIESRRSIRYTTQAGEFREPHANSLGKALMSMLDKKERSKIIGGRKLKQFTPKTLTSVEAIEADILKSQKRGWFVNLAESVPDIAAIAWPVRLSGQTYAISIAGPMHRIEPKIVEFARMLRAACAAIEQKQ